MADILEVTIQGTFGFCPGYIWWMGAEELVVWVSEHLVVGDRIGLRMEWARGSELLDCTAELLFVLPGNLTGVRQGRVFFATYELANDEDRPLLRKGLRLANPDLQEYGTNHIPPALAPFDLYCQAAQLTAGGALFGLLDLSNGLRVRVGGTGCP